MRKLAALRNRSPFIGDQPLDSISLCFYADETGLKQWNNPKDPMPIQIANGKTLKECLVETTSSYDIYCDGGIQLVMGYGGVAQKYIEALNTIYSEETARGYNIMSDTHITSDREFHVMLINTLNQENIEEVERNSVQLLNVRNALEEQPVMPVMAEQRIFIAINFSIYVDKENKCLYIGEGFENLAILSTSNEGITRLDNSDGSYDFKVTGATEFSVKGGIINSSNSIIIGDSFCVSAEILLVNLGTARTASIENRQLVDRPNIKIENTVVFKRYDITGVKYAQERDLLLVSDTNNSNCTIRVKNAQTTKTSVKKPFVRSMFPTGKLAFITGANETTHTFLTKGDGVITFGSGSFSLKGEKVLQLLVYKGLLTEQEKQAELAKDIKLK